MVLKWQIASSIDRDYILELAEIYGWLDTPPKVQVKKIKMDETWWVLEPYEEGCNCPDLVSPFDYWRVIDEDFMGGGQPHS
jgi:hypothetical protein